MARNKYPEETIQRIVQTATRLFLQNGYEQTSMQDIINQLGGLSKGAIYHHFHSKEELLDAVTNHIYRDSTTQLERVLHDTSLTGLQKLQGILEKSVHTAAQKEMLSLSLDMMKNPRVLAWQLQDTIEQTAHRLVLPLVLEGMADGSLPQLAYPQEFAESFMLLANVWVNPMVFHCTPEETERKMRFLQDFLAGQNMPRELLSERTVALMREYAALYQKKLAR